MGLPEKEFWEMTKAEVERYLEGAAWRMKVKAQFDYLQADLFGISIARIFDSELEFPSVEQIYPFLFENTQNQEEQKNEEEIRMENSVNRFMEFALKHNAKHREGSDKQE